MRHDQSEINEMWDHSECHEHHEQREHHEQHEQMELREQQESKYCWGQVQTIFNGNMYETQVG